MTIFEVIKSLIKTGTDRESFLNNTPSWEACPFWPPDLFAVVGTIVEQSGCYTFAGPSRAQPLMHRSVLRRINTLSKKWMDGVHVPRQLQKLWEKLLHTYGDVEVANVVRNEILIEHLLIMFAVADEASVGMGWEPDRTDPKSPTSVFSDYAMLSLTPDADVDEELSLLPHIPYSLCVFVDPEAAVVLPKSITASVGCTVRSLSHHLSLLPANSQVKPAWYMAQPYNVAQNGLRLLIIPFPFTVPDNSFELSADPVPLPSHHHYRIRKYAG